ncbi:hypothetical protein DMN91_007375 [Ooceraea biroi]|uniref:Protein phosphatase 1 regulatory subunit 15A n=1 Tax=Ooceraea biroi TaxID=2015173 RepID=A0A026W8Q1_OOCBI|nr:uncharacterized protein LOC105282825 [Ooceraea biroi]EZA51404.1 Protein phosphatase 1 regulatory subunit 15A [Ooceraea biroi]RLU20762.1 hypothetical protein DMN91_007375 [Ooceraea biroi]
MPGVPLHLGLLSLDLSSEFASCSSASPSCESNVHPAKHTETPSKVAMENIYSTNHVLRGEGNEESPVKCEKKNNFIQTVWNKLARKSAMIFKMDSALSVTVVNNDIIDTNFFEHSAEHKKQPIDEPYNFEIQEKKSLDIKQIPQHTCFEDLKPVDTFKPFIMDHEKFWLYYDDTNEDYMTWTNEHQTVKDSAEDMGFSDTCKDSDAMESHISCNREAVESTNLCPMDVDLEESVESCEEKLGEEKTVPPNININEDASVSAESFCIVSKSDVLPQLAEDPIKEIPISTRLSDMCQKVWKDVTDPFSYGPTCVEDMSEVAAKRLKQHHWKKSTNAVATGKGRGRAKSQLRRSGVSQTSHRKQPRDNFDIDIEDDYEAWQNVEAYHAIEDNHSLSSEPGYFDDAHGYDVTDDAQPIGQTVSPATFNSSDILSMKDKSPTKKETWQGAAESPIQRYVLDSSIAIDEDYKSEKCAQGVPHRDSLRSRLLSESSVDSEDSFCILFDAESEAENTIDIDCDETNSSDQDSEDDSMDTINEDDQSIEELMEARKVKFNPTPIVHVMIKWNYAYRAARKGPWEEMARDNERFRGRINSIAAVLNPILTNQHRLQIWQERFAIQE